jgi:hypothetical protein
VVKREIAISLYMRLNKRRLWREFPVFNVVSEKLTSSIGKPLYTNLEKQLEKHLAGSKQ